MSLRIGINGLGRIGRCLIRAIYELDYDFHIVAVNGSSDVSVHRHLLQYDSVHGKFGVDVLSESNSLIIKDKVIPLLKFKNPNDIPWSRYGAQVVLECTGAFNSRALAAQHLGSTVEKVVVSAPVSDSDVTIVYGVNNEMLKKNHEIISAASCTTNCLAPVLKIMNETLRIGRGFMTTIHSYTGDQRIVDSNHADIRRSRASSLSMIPTTTGAAKAIDCVIPELKGRINGTSIRVPTPNVSVVDLVFTSIKKTSVSEIDQIFRTVASKSEIIDVSDDRLVSVDFIHNSHSAIIDSAEIYVTNDTLCRVMAWYDNEWAFSVRMLDIVNLIAEKKYLSHEN